MMWLNKGQRMNIPAAGLALCLLLHGPTVAAVEGVVLDAQGLPASGYSIHVVPHQAIDRPVAEVDSASLSTVTDGTGRFHLELPDELGDRAVVLEVQRPLDSVGGRIRWDPNSPQGSLTVNLPIVETIVLLHDNDQHFDFNAFDEFRSRVEAYRAENDDVFLLNAGDILVWRPERWELDGETFHGDKSWYRDRSFEIIEKMNRIGYQVMTMGNHELAYVDNHTRQALELADFPLLASNVELSTDRLPPVVKQVVFPTSTLRTIAVIGLTLGNAEGVRILDRNQVTEGYRQLSEQHDVVVALNHIGYRADKELAERFPFLDVIIGGHSHTLLEEAETVNTVLVAQAGGSPHQASSTQSKYLGVITLTLEDGVLTEKRGQVITFPVRTVIPQAGTP